MNLKSFPQNGVIVKRTLNHASENSGNVDYEGYLDGLVVANPFPSFQATTQLLGFIESVVFGFLLVFGILAIFVFVKLRGKYKCPKCGKSYCWYKKVPETCRRCGTKLDIPQINLPK
jgi:hypothetical protein